MMASLAANLNGMRWLRVSSFLVALAWLLSATPGPSLSGQAPATTVAAAGSASFQWKKPAWAPTPAVPADNPMSVAKLWLGRRLFYDKRLSVNCTLACASCHQQAYGFTDGRPTHPGATGEPGVRSVMTLTNVAYLPSSTWANPLITSLEKQMPIPLFSDHPLEMARGGHEAELSARLAADAEYPREFAEAFPHEETRMDVAHVTKAIAAFERTLLSFDSPYGRYKHGDANAISAAAKRGEALFSVNGWNATTATTASISRITTLRRDSLSPKPDSITRGSTTRIPTEHINRGTTGFVMSPRGHRTRVRSARRRCGTSL